MDQHTNRGFEMSPGQEMRSQANVQGTNDLLAELDCILLASDLSKSCVVPRVALNASFPGIKTRRRLSLPNQAVQKFLILGPINQLSN